MKAGWIDREGKLHLCADWQHDFTAMQMGLDSAKLDSMLWIRFSHANNRFDFDRNTGLNLTQRQIDTCFDLAIECSMMDEFNELIAFFA